MILITIINDYKGPRIDTCGTPHILETLEKEFCKFSINFRFIKLIILNFFKSMSWLIASNAF